MSFLFQIASASGSSRAGILKTPHGSFKTPAFMPCGTKGAVRTLTPDELRMVGCEIILANTFHLAMRPGEDLISKMGGLHKWIGWSGPILTDSGGFQVFSLRENLKITANGVVFKSPLTGAKLFLSPEKSIKIQEKLEADIIMAFDECPPGEASYDHAKSAMQRTHEWAVRSLKAHKNKNQTLFPIIQGGIYKDLRIESSKFTADLDTFGIAVGGVAVGESHADKMRVLDVLAPHLPEKKPHYLMGIGEPEDILEAVSRGFDMFDCVLPTRLARHASFWDESGRHDIRNAVYKKDKKPLQKDCGCLACVKFSKSYIRHLMIEKEILGHRLLTIHNLSFLIDLMRKIRKSIESKSFQSFKTQFLKKWTKTSSSKN